MPMVKARPRAARVKALTIAHELGAAEAARATGIPPGTIRCWLAREKARSVATVAAPKTGVAQRRPKASPAEEAVAQEAMAKAREEAVEYVAERLKSLATRLYGLAEKAASKVEVAIADVEETPTGKKAEPHNQAGAAWVRSLVGVFAQSLEKAQLLAGKPTGRTEVLTADEARERLARSLDELAERRRAKTAAGGTA